MKTNLKISLAAAAVITSCVPNLALADTYTIYYDSVKGEVVYDLYDSSTDTTTIGIDLTGNDIERLSHSKNYIEIDIGDDKAIGNKFRFYGGNTSSGAVENNFLQLASGIINADLVGGITGNDSVRNSTIRINGGTIKAVLYGMSKGDVYGGISTSGAVTGSDITISGGTIEGSVYAGETNGDVSYSTITYIGGNVKGDIAGRYSLGNIYDVALNIGDYTEPVELSAAGIRNFNKVKFTLPKPELISNGFTALTLTDRSNGADLTRTDISVDSLESYIKGNNTYYLIKSAFGIFVDDTWLTNNQNLTGKEINVISSSQYNLAKGGIYKSSDDKELYISSTTSTETITGDTFGDDEAGIKDGIKVNLENSDYDKLNINIANSATINLTNAHNVGSVISSGSTLDIKGGSTFDTGASIDVKTVNFGDSSDAMVMDIYNISALKAKELNFYLPSNVANDETALKVANSVDLSGTKVNAYLKDATGITSKDDKIHLIQTAGSITGFAEANGNANLTNVNIAGLINVTGKIAVDDTSKYLDLSFNGDPDTGGGNTGGNEGGSTGGGSGTGGSEGGSASGGSTGGGSTGGSGSGTGTGGSGSTTGGSTGGSGTGGSTTGGSTGGSTANESAKTLLETKSSQSVAINEGANLLVSNLGNIANAANNESQTEAVAFAFASGYDKEITTGSHIDIKGFNANAGIAGNDYFSSGNLTTGLFVEYGKGEYDSFLDDGTKGSGKTEFIGGGAFARFTTLNNFYTEVSGRVGQVKTKYETTAAYKGFDISNTYYGAHLGLGKIFELTSSNDLDIFVRGIWAKTAGNDLDLNGIKTHFDSVTSKRAQVGFKDNIKLSDTSKLYAGASYQYEFDGEAKGKLSIPTLGVGGEIASPKLKGSTGIGEIGYVYENSSIKFEVGTKGYVGKEKGYSGNLGVTIKF